MELRYFFFGWLCASISLGMPLRIVASPDTAQIDGKGNRIEFKYAAGRLVSQRNPLGQVLEWRYDDRGRLATRINGIQTVAYAYDDRDRLVEIHYSDIGREDSPGNNQHVRYTYDARGRVETARTRSVSQRNHYDELGRIVAKVFKRAGAERVLRYTWNSRNQKTSVALSEKLPKTSEIKNQESTIVSPQPSYRLLQQTEYVYSPDGSLAELKSNNRSICKYFYDPRTARLVARKYGNGIEARYTYDAFGRQARMTLAGGPLLEPLLLAYEWDSAGQVLSRTWNGEKQLYTYDSSGQLLAVQTPDPDASAITKVSNPKGNGTGANSPTPNSSLLNSKLKTLESYSYDLAGNIERKLEYGTETEFTYDAANQLAASTESARPNPNAEPDSRNATSYQYDLAGRLIASKSGSESRTRSYGYLDKPLVVTTGDGRVAGFDYYPDGQFAAKYLLSERETPNPPNPKSSSLNSRLLSDLVWDDLALLYRDGIGFAVEPHVSGGSPVASVGDPSASPTYHIGDILSTTLAVVTPDAVRITPLTAFGKPRSISAESGAEPAPPTISPENGSLEKTKENKTTQTETTNETN